MVAFLASLVLMLISPVLVILLADSLYRAFFMWITRHRVVRVSSRLCSENPLPRIAVIIPAHDEEEVIGYTVGSVRLQVPDGAVFVIADHCGDRTAEMARRAGAVVWEREEALEKGKGAALRWFLREAAGTIEPYDAVAIFDADSQVHAGFMQAAAVALERGPDVVQGFVSPLSSGSPSSDLAAFSEFLSQRLDDEARDCRGWPVPLRGTGMVFRRGVMESILPHLKTKVEDVEMTLLLLNEGKQVCFAADAVLNDPKPGQIQGVAIQRARWLQGQREVLACHGSLILRLFLGGRPSYISVLFAVLLRPKSLALLLKLILFAILWCCPLESTMLRYLLLIVSGFALLVDALYFLLGLKKVEEPLRYALALLQAPIYLVMWLSSFVLSIRARDSWLSVRRLDGSNGEDRSRQ